MTSSNSVDESSNERCKYDVKCIQAAVNHCQGCRQIYCADHYVEHQKQLQICFDQVAKTQGLLNEKLKLLISQLSADIIFELIEQIYGFKMKWNEIEKTTIILRQQLEDLNNKNSKKESITMTNESTHDQGGTLEKNIERLRKDTKKLKLKLKEIINYSEKNASQEQLNNHDMNGSLDNLAETTESNLTNLIPWNKKNSLRPVVGTRRDSAGLQADDNTSLSHLLLKQMSPAILDLNRNELDLTEADDEKYPEGEEDMTGVISSDSTSRISQKIRLSNNIVKYLRGPIKVMVNGTMHVVDVCAQGTHISNSAVEAVKQGLTRQTQLPTEQETTKNSFKPAFVEITSDWIFEGENSDRGFSSPSIWMRDPQGRRILVKTQEHPLCAANEWLAYKLGSVLGLPVNEVQISIYQNELVTLHTDVTQENEKVMTFMDLPRHTRQIVMSDPTMAGMDLFDHIIQNVDRNQRNILITIPNTTTFDDETAKMKIFFIDHSSCFGMGKLNFISIIAAKFHSNHLSVVKFDPVAEAKKFERYLSKLPSTDRTLIRKTLNRFAAITNEQFDSWLTEVQDLLSASQYNRIDSVLHRQRDILRRYTIQWGICPRSSSVRLNETNEPTSEINDTVTHF